MIFTARQLEELFRAKGQITLPYRARLTPLAQDWLRQKKITIGYSDVDSPKGNTPPPPGTPAVPVSLGNWLWWADGPCGPAKAALLGTSRELGFNATEIALDPRQLVDAIKQLAGELKGGKVNGGFLLVGNGAQAMVFANRCPSIRAVLGTCIEAVEQGVRLIGANVLVIEHPYKSLQQAKTLIGRFVRAKREFSPEVQKQLSELSSCG